MEEEYLEIGAEIPQYDLLEEKVMVPNYDQMASRFSESASTSVLCLESRRSDGITKWDRIRNNKKTLKRVEKERRLLKEKRVLLKKESYRIKSRIELRDWLNHAIFEDLNKIDAKLELLDEMEEWLDKEFMHLHGLDEKKPPEVLRIKLI